MTADALFREETLRIEFVRIGENARITVHSVNQHQNVRSSRNCVIACKSESVNAVQIDWEVREIVVPS